MCQVLFKELLTWIILFSSLSRCIYISYAHTDLNILQRPLTVIESFNPQNKFMARYHYYSNISKEIKAQRG